jgi:hypothetical protein
VEDYLKIPTDPALVSDVLVGAADSSPGDGEDVADDGGDEHVESATKPGDYAPAFRLQLRKTTVSRPPNFINVSLLITSGSHRTTHTFPVRIPFLVTSWKLLTIQRQSRTPSTFGK